ncbi:MAG TPA: hypothetical protein VLN45_13280 [Ignavibacteriaceae bacterium]|nr:hypothetical protein [Ignavibacteriaceae bacterium]
MIKKNRDSKFIIYQVLYIFVITVLALKGADLDLSKVVREEESVDRAVRDSLVAQLDSLYAQNIKFSIEIDPDIEVENIELKEKLISMNQKIQTLTEKVKEIPEEKPEDEITEEQTLLQMPISIKQIFIQHTWNKAKNTGSVPTYIYDSKNMNNPITVIPPGEEKTFDLTDQNEIVIKFGSQEEKIKVNPNKPPEVKIEKVTTKMGGSNIYVTDLQKISVFKVSIIDERPDQLKATFSGPISVTGPVKDSKGNLIYNVSLKLASNETRFDEWLDKFGDLRDPEGRYKANFFFTVVDERSKDRVQVGDSFIFTDFSK